MSIEPSELEVLFDAIPDVLFFVKDRAGRYTHVNVTMLRRLGLRSRSELIGKRVNEVYPRGLSAEYAQQDARVLAGETIENVLEVHLFPNGEPGWGLTCKRPWWANGEILGVIGITRDLGRSESCESQYVGLRRALAYLNTHYSENVRMQTLVEITGFSLSKLERTFRKVLQLTPQQVLTKLRIQIAMDRLAGDESVAAIGQACGFTDQSAFTRQFKALTGQSPRDYRSLIKKSDQWVRGV